jgi:RecJ-like exonuclease
MAATVTSPDDGDSPVPELAEDAARCARRLAEADRVLLASHIDADGLTSAAIASTALERAGIPHEVVFEKQLDAASIAGIADRKYGTVLFTDFGSGQLDVIAAHERAGHFDPVVVDHHQPATGDATDGGDCETEFHLNPLLRGLNGAAELSGAGAAYVLARALEPVGGDREHGTAADNRDLAALAVVGAVGDMQASGGELHGANAAIVTEGVAAGVLEEGQDIAVYGKQTRPLPKLLEYATDTFVPGISNDEAGAIEFLQSLDLDLQDESGTWRTWVDLERAEQKAITSGLVERAVRSGVPARKAENLVGTTYTLLDEPVGTELRDASEFSTLLNATARYERADVGLAVCRGDRDAALARARRLLRDHRRNLSEGLEWVKRTGVTREDNLQWFDAGEEIRETIVGIIAGMAVGTSGVDRNTPIVAFARKSDEETKVSSRGTPALVGRGLDLSAVMGEAAAAVGGGGGGHDVAAGATIPAGEERAFIDEADRIVGEQLG